MSVLKTPVRWMAPSALGLTMMLSGCLSPETVRRIEGTPGQEGTGIFLTRLPEVIKILATHDATDAQRDAAAESAAAARAAQQAAGKEIAEERYLVVGTTPDERSEGAVSVMLWDTQTEEIVGNNVYDLAEAPADDRVAMLDGYQAAYVVTGATL